MLIIRHLSRRGPVFIAGRLGMHASTVGRVLHRHRVPLIRELDPVTGRIIRARRATAARYEHDHPGSLIHVDVKKLGRIPDGGGWRADPTQTVAVHRTSHLKIGYDYVHTAIDDHSRVAYAEVHDDEKGVTAAGFLDRAVAFYAALGVRVERVISDNAFAYRHSTAFRGVINAHGITQKFIRPHCPWTNGKVERLNRTLATEWAYARPWNSNTDRTAALPTWLDHYNLDRHHLGIGGIPIDRINNGRGQYS
ncbi:transposase InsO family protein [Microbacterium sp. SORGH_AS 888]|nr:transposase InsO family protein [Microbacterium sp. SORGH_AS_0888]